MQLYIFIFVCTAADLETFPVDMQWSYQKILLEAGYIIQLYCFITSFFCKIGHWKQIN